MSIPALLVFTDVTGEMYAYAPELGMLDLVATLAWCGDDPRTKEFQSICGSKFSNHIPSEMLSPLNLHQALILLPACESLHAAHLSKVVIALSRVWPKVTCCSGWLM
jgi:hypothetical protein